MSKNTEPFDGLYWLLPAPINRAGWVITAADGTESGWIVWTIRFEDRPGEDDAARARRFSRGFQHHRFWHLALRDLAAMWSIPADCLLQYLARYEASLPRGWVRGGKAGRGPLEESLVPGAGKQVREAFGRRNLVAWEDEYWDPSPKNFRVLRGILQRHGVAVSLVIGKRH